MAGRHGVGPRELVGEADAHRRAAEQHRPVDVELAGHGEVDLPEAQFALPREVRVGEQHAALATGDRSAPIAQPLLPMSTGRTRPLAGEPVVVVPSGGGGWALAMKSVIAPLLASSATDRA